MFRKLLIAISLLSTLVLGAGLTLDSVFSSHMVLQQRRPIRFFGTADAGKAVKVSFADKTVTTKADASGVWQVEFPEMTASHTPLTLQITSGKEHVNCDDILIGEVWFCSGQSNMEMPIGVEFKRGWSVKNCVEEAKNADYPEIRYAQRVKAFGHQRKLPAVYDPQFGGWVRCTPENAPYFSATSYFFGRKLYQDLQVPIGLLNVSYRGTNIVAWISQDGFRAANLMPELEMYQKYALSQSELNAIKKREQKRFFEQMAAWHPQLVKLDAPAKAKAAGWRDPALNDSSWRVAKVQNIRSATPIIRWFRCHFTLPENMRGRSLTLKTDTIGNEATIFLNGKEIGAYTAEVKGRDKLFKITLPAESFNATGDNVLAVRSEITHRKSGAVVIRNVIERCVLSSGKATLPLTNKWVYKNEFVFNAKKHADSAPPKMIDLRFLTPQFPSTLYNGMVDAWTRLPIRGVIWYQGCNDNGKSRYYLWQKALIADWRAKWGDPEMPFIITQLAGYEPTHANNWRESDPNKASGYALIREIQCHVAQETPRVGIACLIDIGEYDNIHPVNKQDVGLRLALEAERIAYGKTIVSRGPMFREAKVEGDKMRVIFDNADGGLTTSDGKAPGAFAIAGEDGVFHWAEAVIDGKDVVVSSPQVKEPRFVRYAYAAFRGDCNLRNREGLPAYPFRSDALDYNAIR